VYKRQLCCSTLCIVIVDKEVVKHEIPKAST